MTTDCTACYWWLRYDVSRKWRRCWERTENVEYWIRGFEEKGLAALREGERSGGPRRLSEKTFGNLTPLFGGCRES